MSAGLGNIHRVKILIEKSAYHLLQNASREKADGRRLWLVSSRQWLSKGPPRSELDRLRLWALLERLGVSRCRVMMLRRAAKRWNYPWLAYCVPTAVIFLAGDLIAQRMGHPNVKELSLCTFFERCWNRERTLAYFLQGLLLVGPILSWWSLYLFRKLRCKKRLTYILVKTFVDVFILGPLVVTLMALIYDQTNPRSNLLNTDWEKMKKRFRCRQLPAVREVVLFHMVTRPVVTLLVCLLAPPHLRRSLRVMYHLALTIFLSRTFARYHLGRCQPVSALCPIAPPPPLSPACATQDTPRPPPPPEVAPDKKTPKRSTWRRIWNWPC